MVRALASFGPATCTDIVRDLVQQKVNVVVAGATSSGKTSLISSVSQSFAPTERIVCVEDTAELRVAHPPLRAITNTASQFRRRR